MQRSRAAVSVEVKQVIAALCRLLAATGLEAVPSPETFRRAKFCGGVEVEDQFLQLLANILQTANNVSCEAHAQLSGASIHRSLVAAGLWQTGYHAAWVYGREEGGRSFSGRDLLLALGWLLATGTLERLLTQRAQQLDKTLVRPTLVNPHLSCELQLDSALLRKLQWLIGCLRYQGWILLSMQEEQTHLLYAVSAAVLSSPVSSSYKSSAVLMEDCARAQQLCDLLEAYLDWKQVEKVFWTWMDSVVDCHLTDPVVGAPNAPNWNARVCHHGNRGLEKLEDMQLRLPTGQLGQWSGSGDAEDRREGRQRLQELFDTSSLPPPLSSLPSLPSFPQVFQARLQTEKPVKGGGAGGPDALPSTQAARLLLQAEALLLEMRDRHRLANRMQLQEMIGRLDELVLIPP